MNIVAFVLSIMTAVFSLFMGGCTLACSGGIAQSGDEKTAVQFGVFSLILIIASIVSIIGGISTFRKTRWGWKALLAAAILSGISGFGAGIGFIAMLPYIICTVLAFLDYKERFRGMENNRVQPENHQNSTVPIHNVYKAENSATQKEPHNFTSPKPPLDNAVSMHSFYETENKTGTPSTPYLFVTDQDVPNRTANLPIADSGTAVFVPEIKSDVTISPARSSMPTPAVPIYVERKNQKRKTRNVLRFILPFLFFLIVIGIISGGYYYLVIFSAKKNSARATEIGEKLLQLQQAALSFFEDTPQKLEDFDFLMTNKSVAARSLAPYIIDDPKNPDYLLANVAFSDSYKWYVGYNLRKENKNVKKELEKRASYEDFMGNIQSDPLNPALYIARNNEVWLHVDLSFLKDSEPDKSASSTPVSSQVQNQTNVRPQLVGLVQVSAYLNLRSSPNTSASILAQIPNNYLLPVIDAIKPRGEDIPWYKVNNLTYGQGWLNGAFLTISKNADLLDQFQRHGEKEINIMYIQMLNDNIKKRTEDFIRTRRLPVYLQTEGSFELVSDTAHSQKAAKGKNINVRREPHTQAPIIAKLNTGDSVSVLATWKNTRNELWYFVLSRGFGEGWIHGDYLQNLSD